MKNAIKCYNLCVFLFNALSLDNKIKKFMEEKNGCVNDWPYMLLATQHVSLYYGKPKKDRTKPILEKKFRKSLEKTSLVFICIDYIYIQITS